MVRRVSPGFVELPDKQVVTASAEDRWLVGKKGFEKGFDSATLARGR